MNPSLVDEKGNPVGVTNVFARRIGDDSRPGLALLFVNTGAGTKGKAVNMNLNGSSISKAFPAFSTGTQVSVRDIWAASSRELTLTAAGIGVSNVSTDGCVLLVLRPAKAAALKPLKSDDIEQLAASPCAPVYSSGPFLGGDVPLKPCGATSSDAEHAEHSNAPQYKAMDNGECEAGWEPIKSQGAYGQPGSFAACAKAALALKIVSHLNTNGTAPNVGGRDEQDLPAGCYFYELPVQGVEVFFGMQGAFDQRDGQRKAICQRRPASARCCTPNTALELGHGAMGNPFSSGMVLQHAPQKAAIFGLAKAGTTVAVHYAGKAYAAKANPDPFAPGWIAPLASNSWRVELDPQPAGPAKGNISISCAGCAPNASSLQLSGVFFGEVIICSGQSNSKIYRSIRIPALL